LTNRVKIGNPIYTNTDNESNAKDFVWKIPYDVSDYDGNEAITIYRIVKVVEMCLKELEQSIEEDIMKNKEKEIEEAVNEALIKERKKRAQEERKTVKCPVCKECSSEKNFHVSPESCSTVCEQMEKKSSRETCIYPGVSSEFHLIDMIKTFFHENRKNYFSTIISIVLGGILVLHYIRIYRYEKDQLKIDDEHERALQNAVTYHRSPPPLNRMDNSNPMNNYSSVFERDEGSIPPPRATMSFTTTPTQEKSSLNIFSSDSKPTLSNRSNQDENIYQDVSPS